MHRVFATSRHVVRTFLAALVVVSLGSTALRAQDRPSASSVRTIPGMPPVVDARNIYSEIGADKLSPAVAGALSRVTGSPTKWP